MNAIETRDFGRTSEGVAVRLFTLRSSGGMLARITSYGATVTDLRVPDAAGRSSSVLLGAEALDPYLAGFPAAAVIGRVVGAGETRESATIWAFRSPEPGRS